MSIYLNGLLLGLSLVMALGPQNVFLIKQGARRNHAVLSTAVCFICDIILASASVAGLHQLLLVHPTIEIWLVWFGSTFLLYYALKAFRNAFARSDKETGQTIQPHNRMQIILFALGFSLLNPHAIIDTVVIIGSGSSQFPDNKLAFLAGVLSSSFIWFSSLTLTTRFFANILTKTRVWQTIELLSGVLMTFIGIKLALSAF
ncbi:LysE/ArgO family amino acid transporter [Legionella worsleiensis]|uniref:LysE family transporter n=1 Tax=Legionella worsleiensis TaxID=45076 RepID=A0A0W1AES0_9GAMM|nr:LysE family transporter [Legionella worsleiensis]KTD79764.1 LysE family transporter [Legionella worsleiensis]STY32275.1 LysE family transporter [Legionella worsleiensis]